MDDCVTRPHSRRFRCTAAAWTIGATAGAKDTLKRNKDSHTSTGAYLLVALGRETYGRAARGLCCPERDRRARSRDWISQWKGSVPYLYAGCLVHPSFVPCRPLGCVLSDACDACRPVECLQCSYVHVQSGCCAVVVTSALHVTSVGRLRVTVLVRCVVFTVKEYLLVCGSSVDGEGARVSVLFMGCLVAAVRG